MQADNRTDRGSVVSLKVAVRTWHWWCNGLARTLIALILCAAAVSPLADRYRFWTDPVVGDHCLPYHWYLVDLDNKGVGKGDLVAFRSRGTEPFYPTGTMMLKRIVGVSGDRVRVDPTGVYVNGTFQGGMQPALPGGRLWRIGRHVEVFARDERIPSGQWWVMATHPRSFDSRYFGYVSNDQIVGKAWPLW